MGKITDACDKSDRDGRYLELGVIGRRRIFRRPGRNWEGNIDLKKQVRLMLVSRK
jgi:hypothetical protein